MRSSRRRAGDVHDQRLEREFGCLLAVGDAAVVEALCQVATCPGKVALCLEPVGLDIRLHAVLTLSLSVAPVEAASVCRSLPMRPSQRISPVAVATKYSS